MWWVFLFLFFLFMLFIIATNNPNTQEASEIIEQEIDADVIDPIDALIERLENEDAKDDISQENRDEEVRENSDIKTSSHRWFFARLFWINRWEEVEEQLEVIAHSEEDIIWESWTSENSHSSNSISSSYNTTDNDYISQVYVNNSGFIRKWDNTSSWVDTSLSSVYSENRISSLQDTDKQIWAAFFEVNPYSLRLNNKYFSETLWYLMAWDILKQIWNKNNYGCFEVEVYISQTAYGKVWYVCEKYLTYLPHGILETEIVPLESISDIPNTKIWDVIVIEADQFDIQWKALFSWDSIDQMSEIDTNWCFIGRVYSVQSWWYKELVWLVQTFCLQELYR